MPSASAPRPSTGHHPSPGPFDSRDGLTGLLRSAHIFASVVQDVLEIELMRQVTSAPLTPSQFSLLKLISRNGHHQVSDVARMLGISTAAATKNVDKLERLELAVRVPSPNDRRATLLASSPAGRRLVAAYEKVKAERLMPVLEEFTDDELAGLARLLNRLSVGLLAGGEREQDRLCLRCSGYYDPQCSIRRLGVRCPYARKPARST